MTTLISNEQDSTVLKNRQTLLNAISIVEYIRYLLTVVKKNNKLIEKKNNG